MNVLNLVQGAQAIVESPKDSFAPVDVHYAETFIVPAEVGKYVIRPGGRRDSEECATMKAFVRPDLYSFDLLAAKSDSDSPLSGLR